MTPSPSGWRRSCRFLRAVIPSLAVLFGETALLPLHADTYQFVVEIDPAANVSYSVESAATSLETATRRSVSAASPLEARSRTRDASDGIALRSDKFGATMIFFR